MITLARFATIGEAEIARGALRAAGIEAVFADEATVSINWLYSNALGGIKLQIREEDLERARAVLSNAPMPDDGVVEDDTPPDSEEPVEELSRCPSCGSRELTRVPRVRLFILFLFVSWVVSFAFHQHELAVAAIIAGIIIVLLAPSTRCRACGEHWSPDTDPDAIYAPPPDASDRIEIQCPRCGSDEFNRIDYRKLKALPLMAGAMMFLILPLWTFLPKRKCDSCGFKM
jgi:Zn finger protein HypA/HybF involved in hydrogenase expression